jgi:hypothetical protein
MVVIGILLASVAYMSAEEPVFEDDIGMGSHSSTGSYDLPGGRYSLWLEVNEHWSSDPADYNAHVSVDDDNVGFHRTDRTERREIRGITCFLLGNVRDVPQGIAIVDVSGSRIGESNAVYRLTLYLLGQKELGPSPALAFASLFILGGVALTISQMVHPRPLEEERDPRDRGEDPELEEGSPVVRRRPGDPM